MTGQPIMLAVKGQISLNYIFFLIFFIFSMTKLAIYFPFCVALHYDQSGHQTLYLYNTVEHLPSRTTPLLKIMKPIQ